MANPSSVVSLATHDRDRVGKLANDIQPQLIGGLRHTMEKVINSLTDGILVSGRAEVVASVDAKGMVTGTSGISENPKSSGLGDIARSRSEASAVYPRLRKRHGGRGRDQCGGKLGAVAARPHTSRRRK